MGKPQRSYNMKEIKAYHCDYCNKYSSSKSTMSRHEKRCYHNPVTKACATCSKLYQDRIPDDVIDGAFYDLPYCKSGIILTHEFRVELKHHCPSWEPKTDDHEAGEG